MGGHMQQMLLRIQQYRQQLRRRHGFNPYNTVNIIEHYAMVQQRPLHAEAELLMKMVLLSAHFEGNIFAIPTNTPLHALAVLNQDVRYEHFWDICLELMTTGQLICLLTHKVWSPSSQRTPFTALEAAGWCAGDPEANTAGCMAFLRGVAYLYKTWLSQHLCSIERMGIPMTQLEHRASKVFRSAMYEATVWLSHTAQSHNTQNYKTLIAWGYPEKHP